MNKKCNCCTRTDIFYDVINVNQIAEVARNLILFERKIKTS